ncbi:MAG: NAD(P)-binding domain-containing protein, partial [Asticcacaulis sp.]|nr:NAD(P)-binding domain-containing protein [Asticcacaulis sp.]
MKLGMIGLGRMGANIARRLMRNGHEVVVYDRDADAVATMASEGAIPATGLYDVHNLLAQPSRGVLGFGKTQQPAIM